MYILDVNKHNLTHFKGLLAAAEGPFAFNEVFFARICDLKFILIIYGFEKLVFLQFFQESVNEKKPTIASQLFENTSMYNNN